MISTFIAVRNQGKYVRAAIDSVMNQTTPPEQLTLIDDASTDNTLEVLRQAAKDYPGAQVVAHKTQQGHINGYNEGILRSSGDMLHLMSGDDILLDRQFYEKGAQALKKACLYSGGLQWMDEAGNLLAQESYPPFNGRVTAELTLRAMTRFGNFICGAATLVRADLQRKHFYDGRYPFTADAVNWARILAHGIPAEFNREVIFLYRRHKGQMTATTAGPEEERERMHKEIIECWNHVRFAANSRQNTGLS